MSSLCLSSHGLPHLKLPLLFLCPIKSQWSRTEIECPGGVGETDVMHTRRIEISRYRACGGFAAWVSVRVLIAEQDNGLWTALVDGKTGQFDRSNTSFLGQHSHWLL